MIMILLTGCYHRKSQDISALEENITIPDYVKRELGPHLLVDAYVIPPNCQTVHSYTAELNIFEADTINKLFFQGQAVKYDNGSENEIILQSAEANAIFCSSMNYNTINYMKEYSLLFTALTPYDPFQKLFNNYEVLYNMKPRGELDGFSVSKVKQLLKEKAESIGIKLTNEPYICIGVDETALSDMGKVLLGQELYKDALERVGYIGDWQKEDACYYILWNVDCNGENILSGNYNYMQKVSGIDMLTNGSTLYACMTKNGVECFNLSRTYKVDKKGMLEGNVISIDKLLENLKYEYRNIILESDLTVKRIEFCMAPILTNAHKMEYKMTPVWTVLIESVIKNAFGTDIRGNVMTFHAVSGERIFK